MRVISVKLKIMLDKILNHFEDFEPKWRFKLNVVGLVFCFVVFWLIHQAKLKIDMKLPEFINLPNFIGNVDSVILALAGGFLVGWILARFTKLNGSRIFRIGVFAGTLIGLMQNVLIETSFGMKLLNQPNVSDPLDVFWGTVFCLIACFVSFKTEQI